MQVNGNHIVGSFHFRTCKLTKLLTVQQMTKNNMLNSSNTLRRDSRNASSSSFFCLPCSQEEDGDALSCTTSSKDQLIGLTGWWCLQDYYRKTSAN